MGRTAFTEHQFLYRIFILLLPLWAVRPIQNFSASVKHLNFYSLKVLRPVKNLSACTVHLKFHYTYGP